MDVLWRAWGEVGEANLFLIAGGVTYALILALFPGLAALLRLDEQSYTRPAVQLASRMLR